MDYPNRVKVEGLRGKMEDLPNQSEDVVIEGEGKEMGGNPME